MKRFFAMGCVVLIGSLCVGAGTPDAAPPAAAGDRGPAARPAGKLIVHEWGTFTGFAGSDGVHLPFRTGFGSDLPGFVMNRLTFAAQFDRKLLGLFFVKGGDAVALQRMETPVVYFYTDVPREVDVRVDFPHGLLTEFYPPVRKMGPKYGDGFGEFAPVAPTPPTASGAGPQTRPATQPATASQGTESFLDWGRVRLVPHPTGDEGKGIPAVTDEYHYGKARNTDSSLVQFTDDKGARQEEKFLFYRGLGNFTLPVTLIARGGDRFELRNASSSPIPAAFIIQTDGDPQKLPRFARFENLAGTRLLTLPSADAAQGDLAEELIKSLIADGLYEKEARAMVATWKASWLNEPGTRVLYLVPRPVTDALLPLHVAPAPDETVRVLVGRIDVLTPEQESRLASMMRAADTTGTVSKADAAMLQSLGRFWTPALQRMINLGGDDARRQVAQLQTAMARPVAERK